MSLSDVVVPSFGESVTTAYLSSFLVKVGDLVRRDQPICELDSDKASMEVPSPVSGKVVELLGGDGDEISVGAVLARIDTSVEVPAEAAASVEAPAPDARGTKSGPAARQAAREAGVDLDAVEGSGRRGRVLSQDVVAAADRPEPFVHFPEADEALEEIVPMSPLRRTIAKRLVEAQQNAAMLTTFNEVDLSGIKALRSRYQEQFVARYGVKLGFMSFFVKAAVDALKDFPAVNAEIRGSDVVYKRYYHVGVAVSTKRGLVVPVLRDADKLSFAQVELGIAELARKARDSELKLADFKGGTFTVSNGGVFGSLLSTPIVNPPQVGILGMHTIQNRPVAVGTDIALRPMMYLALSYDHRIIDGREAVSFLIRIKELVENPERILLEV